MTPSPVEGTASPYGRPSVEDDIARQQFTNEMLSLWLERRIAGEPEYDAIATLFGRDRLSNLQLRERLG